MFRIRIPDHVPQALTRTLLNWNFKDTNPLMSSLLVIFVWGGVAIL
jgi:hypothetical protein